MLSKKFLEHGCPYNRGAADSYYGRARRPHKWPNGHHELETVDLTPEEKDEYHQGFNNNESEGNFKDWG